MRQLYIILLVCLLTGCSFIRDEPSFSFKNPRDAYVTTNKTVTAWVSTDWHYLADILSDNEEAFQQYIATGDGKQIQDMNVILDTLTYELAQDKPDFLIVSGDITNNGEKASHQAIAKRFADIERAGTSVFVIPGNHDIANPWAKQFKGTEQLETETINAASFADLYQDFGYKEAISHDPASLSYLAAPSNKIWLLMLDSAHYQENLTRGYPEINGSLTSETLNWLEACFDYAAKYGARIIPVMHHNIAKHNQALSEGYTLDNYEHASGVLARLSVPFVLSGHIHAQDISEINGIYDIATSALSVYPQQYGVLNYHDTDAAFSYKTKQLDVAAWAKHAGINDQKWQQFDAYAADYFGSFAFNLANQALQETTLPDKTKHYLADTMITLNQRFFAGTEALNENDLLQDSRFKHWEQLKETFIYRYVQSIQADSKPDDNQLLIPLQNK